MVSTRILLTLAEHKTGNRFRQFRIRVNRRPFPDISADTIALNLFDSDILLPASHELPDLTTAATGPRP